MIENELSRPFNLEKVKKDFTLDITADEQECRDLATRFRIKKINMVEAHCVISNINKKEVGDYQLKVNLNAEVVQECVITLEDVVERVREDFLIIFRRGQNPMEGGNSNPDLEIEPDDDDIEYINSTEVDIGEYLAEYFSLAINPYPRREDIDHSTLGYEILQEDEVPAEEVKKNPFNVLADLKHRT